MIRNAISAVLASIISVGAVFALLIVVSDAGWRVYSAVIPAENWMQIGSILVDDSFDGECPTMEVERTIAKPFLGEWRVEAEKKVGNLYVFRGVASGENSYNADAKLPADLDLGWWTLDQFCKKIDGKSLITLSPGTYRINTTWVIDPEHYPPKRISINSNDFIVN